MNLLPLINRKQRSHFVSPLAGKHYYSHNHSDSKVQMATIGHTDTNRSMNMGRSKAKVIKTERKIKMSYVEPFSLGT